MKISLLDMVKSPEFQDHVKKKKVWKTHAAVKLALAEFVTKAENILADIAYGSPLYILPKYYQRN